MAPTFVNLSQEINQTIAEILNFQENTEWIQRAELLHNRYMAQKKDNQPYVQDFTDALAYLALRTPATYAQHYSTFSAIQELVPSWQPKTLLDIGSGPGTSLWAAQSIWPTIKIATCLDQNTHMLSLGQQILNSAKLPTTVSWQQQQLPFDFKNDTTYDLVVVANVLNELSVSQGEKLLGQAYNKCQGIMIVIEPGTPFGNNIVQSAAKKFAHISTLIAPFINNALVIDKDYWIHFSQRFIRPEFTRRIRQHMRDSSLMASDWEETKYSFVAISKIPAEKTIWGRCVGQITKENGFLTVPILTQYAIEKIKVMKRNKDQYTFAKNLKWGQCIEESKQLVVS